MLIFSSRVARTVCAAMVIALSAACHAVRAPLVGQGSGRPVELQGVPAQHLVRSPSMAARSDTVFVAGNVLPTAGDSLLPRPAYLGRLLQGPTGQLAPLAPLGLPPGDFQFAYPRVGVSRDAVHLVWAEFAVPRSTATAWLVSHATTLWHSALREGSWSTPERIAIGTVLGWNQEMGAIAVTDAGTLHVAVGVSDSLPAVRHIRFASGRWHTTNLRSGGWGPSALASSGDTVLIALVDEQAPGYRVMLFQSNNAGGRWAPPIVASSRENGTVASLALTASAGGTLLAIAEKPLHSFYLDTIRLVRSAGGEPVAGVVAPPHLVSSFVLTAAPCGSAVMLASTFSTTPQIFALRIPRDSLAARFGPLLRNVDIAAFPGVGSTERSALAVFAYRESPDRPVRSVVMPLAGCTAISALRGGPASPSVPRASVKSAPL